MTHNQLIACDSCNTEINLRSQIGYFDIPFNLYCPKCSTHISGKLTIDQENIGIALTLENAHEEKHADNNLDAKYYITELSAEFPTRKMYSRALKEYDVSPFIRNSTFYRDNQKTMDATSDAAIFTDFIKNDWKKTKSHFELFWNGHSQILYPKIIDEIRRYNWIPLSKVTNDLDAAMALHQLLLTTTGISLVLYPNTLPEYTEIAKLILGRTHQLDKILFYSLKIALDFNNIEKKAFLLIDAFTKIYEQLIPIVALKNADCFDNVDNEPPKIRELQKRPIPCGIGRDRKNKIEAITLQENAERPQDRPGGVFCCRTSGQIGPKWR